MAISNHHIVVVAAYLAGASALRIDTEDIAMKANEIAPGRFTWRKYPSQINIDTVRKRLWDACRIEKGGYLDGSEKDGWLLTPLGIKAAVEWLALFPKQLAPKQRTSVRERSWHKSERQRLLSSDAFVRF